MTARSHTFAGMQTAPAHRRRRHALFVAGSVAVVSTMIGLTFAAVPLYRLFCQVTGFGGTTQVATAAPGAIASSPIAVRFDANVAPSLPWRFTAPNEIQVKLGAQNEVAYAAINLSSEPVLGTAIYNVTPLQVGKYFYKIECFCFTEQLLMPGERKEFPVSFFVDPEIKHDADAQSVSSITLSYTFYDKGKAARDEYLRKHRIAASPVDGDRR